MKSISLEKVKNLRRERNGDLIKRMKTGDQLSSFDSHASWYPPRPIIEKDSEKIVELYGDNPDRRLNCADKKNVSQSEEMVQGL